MRPNLILMAAFLGLAACTAEPTWAPDEAVAARIYHHDAPPSITLYTVINNRSNEGAHSSLLINGSQRLIFDPAGTWYHPSLPERNDVHFGMVDSAVIFYEDYHARVTFRVIAQKVEVSPEVAEEALRLVQANGAVSKTQCANTVSRILRDLGGFDEVPRTMWPLSVMEGFGKIPGVESRTIYDDSTDDNKGLLRQTEI
ncbi:MAG: hypothetical protein ABJO67_12535 [Pseudoruegeria sp.]